AAGLAAAVGVGLPARSVPAPAGRVTRIVPCPVIPVTWIRYVFGAVSGMIAATGMPPTVLPANDTDAGVNDASEIGSLNTARKTAGAAVIVAGDTRVTVATGATWSSTPESHAAPLRLPTT